MVAMDVCNLCNGHGHVPFFYTHADPMEDDLETRRCPACQGKGAIEPWLQVATGVHSHEGWTGDLSFHEEAVAILAIIRQREESR
jgi:DnaJ-class molecular chaperone